MPKGIPKNGINKGWLSSKEKSQKISESVALLWKNPEYRKKMSEAHIGKKYSAETIEKRVKKLKGQKRSIEFSKRVSKWMIGNKNGLGTKHSKESIDNSIKKIKEFYDKKGRITPANLAIRMSQKYIDWRKAVFQRDDYRCMDCGLKYGDEGKKVILNADHILRFSKYPRLRLEINNGQTLCVDCHSQKTIFESKTGIYQILNNL